MRSMPRRHPRGPALKSGRGVGWDIAVPAHRATRSHSQRTTRLTLKAGQLLSGAFWLELPEQWDQKSPWHDLRLGRAPAASLAIRSPAVNQAETLGFLELDRQIV